VCIRARIARNSGPFGPGTGSVDLASTVPFVLVTAAYGGGGVHLTGCICMPVNNRLWVAEHVPEGAAADRPLLVFVHGSLDRARSFTRVLRRLDDIHTLAYDRRGYQHSRDVHPLNLTLSGHVDDLLTVIAGRSAVVVGHSYGGTIALGAALRSGPSPIRAVVAFEPPMPWVEHALGLPGRTATSPHWATADPSDPDRAGAEAERFFRRMVGDASWDRLPEAARESRRADGPALAAELRAIRVVDPLFDVAAMPVPVIYAVGGETLERRRQVSRWLVDHTPAAEEMVIPGAGHGAHLTHPDAFAQLARSGLARAGWTTTVSPA
jgi:pimeloyl-ACP methyl ester carboxylesterase